MTIGANHLIIGKFPRKKIINKKSPHQIIWI